MTDFCLYVALHRRYRNVHVAAKASTYITEGMHCRRRLLPVAYIQYCRKTGYIRTLTNGADTTFTVPCTHIVLRTRQTAKLPWLTMRVWLLLGRKPSHNWFCGDLNACARVLCFHVCSLRVVLQCIPSVLYLLTLAATCTLRYRLCSATYRQKSVLPWSRRRKTTVRSVRSVPFRSGF